MSFRIITCAMFFCVSFCFMPLSTSANQVDLSHQIQPLAQSSLILDIANAGQIMVAVGERGHVLLKKQSWQQVKMPVSSQLTKVFFLNENVGWAVGHDATIIHTTDGGLNWSIQMQSPELEKPFFDILFFDEMHGVAVGAYGLFYRTQDGGQNWVEEFHEELLFAEDVDYLEELKVEDTELYLSERAALLPHFNRIIPLTDGRYLLVGELGLVAYSNNTANNFIRTDFSYEGSIFNAIEFDNDVYVMGLRGNVFKASPSLNNWQSVKMPVESTINGALIVDKTLYLVGNAGAVIKVEAGGSAELVTQKQGENLVAIAQDNQGQIWLAGTKGLSQLQLQE